MKREQIIGLFILLLLTAGTIFAASHSPAEEENGLSEGERAYMEMLEAAPLAVVEGETVSPDQRFLVRAVGATDIYVSGVRVPERVQVVDRSTEKVLWETEGMVGQEALWSPESGFLALARSARTRCSVTVIETENWTSWEFTLPDGSPIPEYTFPAYYEPWGQWRSEHSLDLTFDDGNEGQSRYTCVITTEQGQVTGEVRERTEEILPGSYDFNHDGQPEILELVTFWYPGMTGKQMESCAFRVLDGENRILWEDFAGVSHAGENGLYALRLDGEDYLLQYVPKMGQGYCGYQYRIFSLDIKGTPVVYQESRVEFDINFGSPIHESFDIPAIAAFLKEVHGWLDNAQELVNTIWGEIDLGEVDYSSTAALEIALENYRKKLSP
ncbi:hypothetical protein [uncultured Oscillibacter sp.]|uniref:hypothetical protein n=1 Tax=uncultured Oscillibacter sp. TaxID=876091 RepID=UPI0026266B8F|nr:hypothetical protein [uncultured Oscillibacter sp.]